MYHFFITKIVVKMAWESGVPPMQVDFMVSVYRLFWKLYHLWVIHKKNDENEFKQTLLFIYC